MPRSSSELGIVPYAEVNGVWTIPTADVLEFAEQAIQERSFGIFQSIRKPAEFLEAMQSPANMPVFCFLHGRMVGVWWLSGAAGNKAFAHVLFLRDGWGSAEAFCGIGKQYFFSFMVGDRPMFDVLLAAIPSYNRLAISLAKRVGFVVGCEIPNMVRQKDATHSATLLYLTR